METKLITNAVYHLIVTLGYVADNQQRIFNGEIPLHGKKEFMGLAEQFLRRNQELELIKKENEKGSLETN